MSAHIEIVDVAARDGLQSDPAMLSTEQKVELISRLVRAGIRRVETVSFVNPARVPQMADADAVMAALHADDATRALGASYIGLVLNRRGLDRAIAGRVDEINAVVVCTDTFAERNQGSDTAGLIAAAADVCGGAAEAGIPTTITLAATFGCPYEGEVGIDRLEWVLSELAPLGVGEIALADSIGVAVPTDVAARVALARDVLGPDVRLRCHFHNTRNMGFANATAAVQAGVTVLDASLGGIGGCPFAPNATGNIATEDLVYLLERMGHPTGVDLGRLCETVPWVEAALGHPTPGLVAKAGPFPR